MRWYCEAVGRDFPIEANGWTAAVSFAFFRVSQLQPASLLCMALTTQADALFATFSAGGNHPRHCQPPRARAGVVGPGWDVQQVVPNDRDAGGRHHQEGGGRGGQVVNRSRGVCIAIAMTADPLGNANESNGPAHRVCDPVKSRLRLAAWTARGRNDRSVTTRPHACPSPSPLPPPPVR